MNGPGKWLCRLLLIMLVYAGAAGEESGSIQVKGKMVIVVLDTSKSIEPHFKTIQDVLINTLITKRLDIGDYYVLIEFYGQANIIYSGQIFRQEDIAVITDYLRRLKADKAYTDIGASLKLALDEIVKLRAEEYNLYEPVVLYISDGNHEPPPQSPYYKMTIDQIFNDAFIGDRELYHGWYIVGIGKELKDLHRLAELSGREDYFLTIEDPAGLGKALDDWIRNIPPAIPLEQGKTEVGQISVEGIPLAPAAETVLALKENYSLALAFQSSYKTVVQKVELTGINLSWQSEDKTFYREIPVAWEKGVFTVEPGALRESTARFVLDSGRYRGSGTLKFEIQYKTDYVQREQLFEQKIYFALPAEIFWKNWGVLILMAGGVLFLLLLFLLLRQYLPVAVVMEIPGDTRLRKRGVSFPVGKSAEIGTKPAAPFRLTGAFAPVIGALKRSGRNRWELRTREAAAFKGLEAGRTGYRLGTQLILVDINGGELYVRFSRKGRRKETARVQGNGQEEQDKESRYVRRRERM